MRGANARCVLPPPLVGLQSIDVPILIIFKSTGHSRLPLRSMHLAHLGLCHSVARDTPLEAHHPAVPVGAEAQLVRVGPERGD